MDNDCIEIANEFTTVQLKKVKTGNGVRVEIISPKTGFKIQLDPLQLECLTWQDKEVFSDLLEEPYGPAGEKIDLEKL